MFTSLAAAPWCGAEPLGWLIGVPQTLFIMLIIWNKFIPPSPAMPAPPPPLLPMPAPPPPELPPMLPSFCECSITACTTDAVCLLASCLLSSAFLLVLNSFLKTHRCCCSSCRFYKCRWLVALWLRFLPWPCRRGGSLCIFCVAKVE